MTLRETLKDALVNDWSQELEDRLFWKVSHFVTECCDNVRKQDAERRRKAVKELLGEE